MIVWNILETIERYENYLIKYAVINANYMENLNYDEDAAWWKEFAGYSSFTATQALGLIAKSGDITSAIAIEVGGIVIEQLVLRARHEYRVGKLSRERLAAVEKELNLLQSTIDETQRRNVKAAENLAKRRDWERTKIGFDSTQAEIAPFRKPASTQAVIDARIASLRSWKNRRSEDFFSVFEWGSMVGQSSRRLDKTLTKEGARLMAGYATEIYDATISLIPEGKSYDPYRALGYAEAGDLFNSAAFRDNLASSRGCFSASSQYATQAVYSWRRCLNCCTSDKDGFIRMRLANAYGMAGDLKKSFQLLDEVALLRTKARCEIFPVSFAAVASLTGRLETSIEWLEYAVKTFNWDLTATVRNESDFAAVRQAYPSRVTNLAPGKLTP